MAQAYLDLGPAASHPAPLLKAFVKTHLLQPGASQTVSFNFTQRDVSLRV